MYLSKDLFQTSDKRRNSQCMTKDTRRYSLIFISFSDWHPSTAAQLRFLSYTTRGARERDLVSCPVCTLQYSGAYWKSYEFASSVLWRLRRLLISDDGGDESKDRRSVVRDGGWGMIRPSLTARVCVCYVQVLGKRVRNLIKRLLLVLFWLFVIVCIVDVCSVVTLELSLFREWKQEFTISWTKHETFRNHFYFSNNAHETPSPILYIMIRIYIYIYIHMYVLTFDNRTEWKLIPSLSHNNIPGYKKKNLLSHASRRKR